LAGIRGNKQSDGKIKLTQRDDVRQAVEELQAELRRQDPAWQPKIDLRREQGVK